MTPHDAAKALWALQGRDGLWGAFRLAPGESRVWVTALAARALVEAQADARPAALRALAALGPGPWSYGGASEPDADSTAAVLRLYHALDLKAPDAALAFLMGHDTGRGFATYRAKAAGDLWARPAVDVDAGVCMALHLHGRLTREGLAAVWRDRLARQQRADGTWESLWWQGPGVATSTAAELWAMAGRPLPLPVPLTCAGDTGFDALHLALAAGYFGQAPGSGGGRLDAVITTGRHLRADAVLCAPMRFLGGRGESSPEGRGTMSAVALLRALTLLPLPDVPSRARAPRPALPEVQTPILALARALQVDRPELSARAAAALVSSVLVPLPWPNRALSNLAQGVPVEFSAKLGAGPHLRLTSDLGDPRLAPPDRAADALRALARAAEILDLAEPWARTRRALAPWIAALDTMPPDERFFLWGGLEIGCGRHVLKVYANIRSGGLNLARAMLQAFDPTSPAADQLATFAGRLGQGAFAQQLGFAVMGHHPPVAKAYFELPGHDAQATAEAARALGLAPDRLSPEIPGLATIRDARRLASGLAVRIDPAAGLRPDLTLATQAQGRIRWQPGHEARQIAAWAASLGLDAHAALRLAAALRQTGPAPQSLHTVTLTPKGPQAAIYLRPEAWAQSLTPANRTGESRDRSDTAPFQPHPHPLHPHPVPSPVSDRLGAGCGADPAPGAAGATGDGRQFGRQSQQPHDGLWPAAAQEHL